MKSEKGKVKQRGRVISRAKSSKAMGDAQKMELKSLPLWRMVAPRRK